MVPYSSGLRVQAIITNIMVPYSLGFSVERIIANNYSGSLFLV